MPFRPRWLLASVLLLAFAENANLATVETTADASLHKGALDGSTEILTASSPDDAIFLRFRNALVEHWRIQKAVVAVHSPDGSAPPSHVGVAVVRGLWVEGSSKPPQLTGPTLMPTRVLKDGWFTFELPEKAYTEIASGATTSLALTVQEGGKLAVHSRRTVQFSPYLLVRGNKP